ncbi:EAL domain-containing protein [Vibrio hannami]|uniref:EAL domain-containing protein n=1 Tax=Vibrio hannami TaxID=2717094 RepID=UPI00240FDAE9|nr:EAL domain-containing protein [Vibrio hannami]MDG3085079.1 EAL domain-containing protein [Vibrio hannami]
MIRYLWVVLVLLSHSLSASGLRIDDDFKHLNLPPPLATLVDHNDRNAEQIFELTTFNSKLYQTSINPNTDNYWYKIELFASQLSNPKDLALVSQNHLLQHLDIYLFRDGELIQSKLLGIHSRPATNELYQGVVFKFTMAPKEQITLLIRKQSDGPAILPLSLMDTQTFEDTQTQTLLFWGATIGIFLALAIYNAVVFSLNFNSAQYGWYLLFQLLMFLNFAPLHGFGYLLFPDQFVRLLANNMGTMHLMLLWCALMFAKHFLDIKKYRPRLGMALNKSVWIFLFLLVVNFQITELQRMYVTTVMLIIVSYVCISSAIVAIKHKYYPASYYLLSWLSTCFGASVGFLTYSNLIPQNMVTMHAFMLGVLGELYLLSIGLAKRLQYHELQDRQHRLLDQTLNMPNQNFYQYALKKQFREQEVDTTKIRLILIYMEGLDHLISALGTDKVATETRSVMLKVGKKVSRLPWQLNIHLNKSHFGISIPPMQTMVFVDNEVSVEQQVKTLLEIWRVELADTLYFSDIHVRAASVECGDDDITNLHQKAYMALLEAQKSGMPWLPYNKQMIEKVETHIHILHELRLAIANQEIDIFVQPKVDITSNKVIGGEALMRWPHKQLGMVPPNVFIPLAEQSGLIHSLTLIAINKMFAWIVNTPKHFSLSINISAIDLMQEDFINHLEHASTQYAVDPARITLEITESQELDNSKQLIKKIGAIKQLGFAISLDDFGTGYSSMAYLSQLAVDEVKVDMMFVKEIQNNVTNQAIVKTLLNMADILGARVVVEGIETKEELAMIRELGGCVGQGYYWSQAIAVESFQQQFLDAEADDKALVNSR